MKKFYSNIVEVTEKKKSKKQSLSKYRFALVWVRRTTYTLVTVLSFHIFLLINWSIEEMKNCNKTAFLIIFSIIEFSSLFLVTVLQCFSFHISLKFHFLLCFSLTLFTSFFFFHSFIFQLFFYFWLELVHHSFLILTFFLSLFRFFNH